MRKCVFDEIIPDTYYIDYIVLYNPKDIESVRFIETDNKFLEKERVNNYYENSFFFKRHDHR